ncbi:MFS family permease [Methanomicrobium sp. W14]|uniref:DUF4013 domain-containing protein n=1 Tax=Methanomicrobium sp. W14 TaxID=2817839 RepID=UPI001FD96766|nr:DUF4013 domain-containing protein [Methanomicrobium sp. W14]MBP2132945.1 MFS family permease [Methanomicrobium sp. W14]
MGKDIINSAFSYTKNGFVGEWTKWILLIVCAVIQSLTLWIVPLMNGYLVRVYAGNEKAPEVNEWGKLFIDGWKFNITCILYMIPAIIIGLILGIFSFFSAVAGFATAGRFDEILGLLGTVTGIFIIGIVILILALFMFMGLVRLGKTNRISEAFNFSALNKQVQEGTGWLGYIGYFILLWFIAVIFAVVIAILSVVPFLGLILGFILTPLLTVFFAKYLTNIYDAGGN